MHRTTQSCAALPEMKPYLRLSRFHGGIQLKRKDNSSQDPYRRHRVQLRYRTNPHPSSGILT